MSKMPEDCSVFSRGSEQWLKCHDAVIECSFLNHAEKQCSEEVLSCIYEDAGRNVSPSKSCFNKFTGIAKEWAGEHKPLISFTTSLDAPVISSNKTTSEEIVVVPAIRNKRTGEIIIKDDHIRNPQGESAYGNGKLPLMGFVNTTPQLFAEGLEGTAQLSRFASIAASAGTALTFGAAMNLTDLQRNGGLDLLQPNPDDIEIFPLYVKKTTLSKTEPYYVPEKEWKSFWNRWQIKNSQRDGTSLPKAATVPANVQKPVITTDEENAARMTQPFGVSETAKAPSECDSKRMDIRAIFNVIGHVDDMLRSVAHTEDTESVTSSIETAGLGVGYFGDKFGDYLSTPGTKGFAFRGTTGTSFTDMVKATYGMSAFLLPEGPSKTISLAGKSLTNVLDEITCNTNPVAVVVFKGVVKAGFETTVWKKAPDTKTREPFLANEEKYVRRERVNSNFFIRASGLIADKKERVPGFFFDHHLINGTGHVRHFHGFGYRLPDKQISAFHVIPEGMVFESGELKVYYAIGGR